MSFITHILREVDIFFDFTWRDWSTTLIPGTIFAVGAMRGLPIPTMLKNYLFMIWWMSNFVYFFTLSNQIVGVVEDSVDKKDRPIPSGKVTLAGAKIRWIFVFSSFLLTAIHEPYMLPETLAWVFTTALLNITPVGKHWFVKNNIGMPLGTLSLLSASWKAIAPHTPRSQIWVYGVAAWIGFMMHIQDLRDIKGDTICGRKTMCIVLGDWETRLLTSFVFTPLSMYFLHLAHIVELAPWTLSTAHAFVAYRVLQARGSHYDHKTYMHFTYLFCGILAVLTAESLDLKIEHSHALSIFVAS
ncbi:UbiA prenyltransferase family [Cyathus striatus]|nr:UbiA prenyltransferase family [Cyathus striatus]